MRRLLRMKQITIGDVCIYSEDDDTWDDLIRVVRKANKAYAEILENPGGRKVHG